MDPDHDLEVTVTGYGEKREGGAFTFYLGWNGEATIGEGSAIIGVLLRPAWAWTSPARAGSTWRAAGSGTPSRAARACGVPTVARRWARSEPSDGRTRPRPAARPSPGSGAGVRRGYVEGVMAAPEHVPTRSPARPVLRVTAPPCRIVDGGPSGRDRRSSARGRPIGNTGAGPGLCPQAGEPPPGDARPPRRRARGGRSGGASAIAMKRSGLFGRAPVARPQGGGNHLGLPGSRARGRTGDLRRTWFDEVHLAHHYGELRRLVDAAPERVLRLSPAAVGEFHRRTGGTVWTWTSERPWPSRTGRRPSGRVRRQAVTSTGVPRGTSSPSLVATSLGMRTQPLEMAWPT